MNNAEARFRAAFERIKQGTTEILPIGSVVSQHNVAIEAACTPSSLRKDRFPALVEEIQIFVAGSKPLSQHSKGLLETARRRISKLESELRTSELRYELAASEVLTLLKEVAELKREIFQLTRPTERLDGRAQQLTIAQPKLRQVTGHE